jgi:hypothetical protein
MRLLHCWLEVLLCGPRCCRIASGDPARFVNAVHFCTFDSLWKNGIVPPRPPCTACNDVVGQGMASSLRTDMEDAVETLLRCGESALAFHSVPTPPRSCSQMSIAVLSIPDVYAPP